MNFSGPGSKFELLFELSFQGNNVTLNLPEQLTDIYGGEWKIPTDRQYRYSNFVMSHDGKTSFAVQHHEGGGDISGFNRNDQWLMALCRARADAVTVGANTLRTEPGHIWSSQFIFPSEGDAFSDLRIQEGRKPYPFQVFTTRSGDLNVDAAVFKDSKLDVIVATTSFGAQKVKDLKLNNISILELGESEVDLVLMHKRLQDEFGIMTVLCEGGPKFYASMIQSRQIEEEFLTVSPVVVGGTSEKYRPGLLDGIGFEPGNTYGVTLQSMRRAGNMLFLRSRY